MSFDKKQMYKIASDISGYEMEQIFESSILDWIQCHSFEKIS